MQSLQVSEIDRHRRFLIAAGTADYEHASPLPSVKDDLDRMVKAFQRLGYVCHQEDRILNPSVQDLRDKLSAWFMRPDVSSEDLVVVYYSGHSIGTRYRNYILTRNSDPQRLAATALAADDIPQLLFPAEEDRREQPRGIWVILDTCYSGQGAADVAMVASRLQTDVLKQTPSGSGFYVLACARPDEEVDQGVFSQAFAYALEDPKYGDSQQPNLNPNQLVESINQVFREQKRRQWAVLNSTGVTGRIPFLPNPRRDANILPAVPDVLNRRLTLLGQQVQSEAPHQVGRAFVLMPFSSPFNSYYPAIFKPALEAVGYNVARADDLFTPRPIMLDIQESILAASLILCEMSDRNPNVFYELGLAHAIGKPAILISRRHEDIPFDLRHVRTILYDSTEAGWEAKLRADIEAAAQVVATSNEIWLPPLTGRPLSQLGNSRMVTTDELRAALERIARQEGSTSDLQLLQQALDKGEITAATGKRTVPIDELQEALERVARRERTTGDLQLLQQALDKGEITAATGNR